MRGMIFRILPNLDQTCPAVCDKYHIESGLLLKLPTTLIPTWKEILMAKFYVQSGLFSIIVQARDGEGAALWAVHQFLENCEAHSTTVSRDAVSRAAVNSKGAECNRPCQGHVCNDQNLAATLSVSEVGFGRREAGCYLTDEVMQKYVELWTALSTLGVID